MARGQNLDAATVQLLGSVAVAGPHGVARFAGAKQRAVVARLALGATDTVPVGRLIEDVWGDDPPPTVRAALQVHVSQIRRALADVGLDGLVETVSGGYSLVVPRTAVDALGILEADRAVARAVQREEWRRALTTAIDAASSWRGEPFADVGDAPFVVATSAALNAARSRILCAASDAAIGVAEPEQLLSLVDVACGDAPFDEALWCALARLLYASNRQADALDRLATLRRSMRHELGLEPSTSTAALELRILDQDLPAPRRGVGGSIPSSVGSQLPISRMLLGRDEEVAATLADLRTEHLVTLVGPAGVGKSSVALKIAVESVGVYAEGTLLVDLSDCDDAGTVLAAVAARLGMRPPEGSELGPSVSRALAGRDGLIVLDNCEHVVDEVIGLVNSIGGVEPRPALLLTSRRPLGLAGERVRVIEPLDDDTIRSIFVSSARSADASFADGEDDAAIDRIVRSIDGLPLAAELSAPLVRSMTLFELADHLDLGSSGGRTSVHESMNEALERSIASLTEQARHAFARMSVFVDGCDVNGIAAVCDPGILEASRVASVVAQLVDASLLRADRTPTGTWYRMLHPIRVAARRLLGRTELVQARAAHARHVISTVERLSAEAGGRDPRIAVESLRRNAGNIRTAWETVNELEDRTGRWELLAAFGPHVIDAGFVPPEFATWLASALDDVDLVDDELRLALILNAATLDIGGERIVALLAEAERLADQLSDPVQLVRARCVNVDVTSQIDTARAVDEGLATVEAAHSTGSPVLHAFAVSWAVIPLLRTRDFERAHQLLDPMCASDTTAFGLHESNILYYAGRLALLEDDLERADHYYRLSETAAHRTGAHIASAATTFGLAEVKQRSGQLADALVLLDRAARIQQTSGGTEAWACYTRMATIATDLRDEPTLVRCVAELQNAANETQRIALEIASACLAAVRGFDDIAARSFDATLDKCAAIGSAQLFLDTVPYWAAANAIDAGLAEAEARRRLYGGARVVDALAAIRALADPARPFGAAAPPEAADLDPTTRQDSDPG